MRNFIIAMEEFLTALRSFIIAVEKFFKAMRSLVIAMQKFPSGMRNFLLPMEKFPKAMRSFHIPMEKFPKAMRRFLLPAEKFLTARRGLGTSWGREEVGGLPSGDGACPRGVAIGSRSVIRWQPRCLKKQETSHDIQSLQNGADP